MLRYFPSYLIDFYRRAMMQISSSSRYKKQGAAKKNFSSLPKIGNKMMILIQLIGVVFALFYFFVKRKHSYWKRLGVPHIKPEFFWGNTRGVDTDIHHSEFWRRMYLKLKHNGSPVSGVYLYTEVN